MKENEKIDKYSDLVRELKKKKKKPVEIRVKVVPITAGAHGTVPQKPGK